MSKYCEGCGTTRKHTANRLCGNCADARAAARGRYPTGKKRICPRCNTAELGYRRKLCESCRIESTRESNRRSYRDSPRSKPDGFYKPLKTYTGKSIAEVEAEARARGMSYGQYSAIYDGRVTTI